MEIKRDAFAIKIFGKCTTEKDILELYNFGYSKKNVVKKYKKDNKLNDYDARKIVEDTLLKVLTKRI